MPDRSLRSAQQVYETLTRSLPPGSPFFLNAVLELFIREEPEELLQRTSEY